MPNSKFTYTPTTDLQSSVVREEHIEYGFIGTLQGLKYEYRPDITDRATLEANFRQKFEALNRVTLTDAEFARLLEEIITPDVFAAAKTLRSINSFTHDDGTPLNYSLVNLKDWCKNTFEIVNQLRINTDYSHHRYDVLLLINGVPCVQIELKTLGVNPRRAMEQIVEYKNDPGNGYTRFKAEKNAKELAAIASKHSLTTAALQTFVDGILDRMIFDGEQLSDLLAPLNLGWRARTQAELALMADLVPLLTKRAGGRDVSGLSAYEV